MADVVNLDIQEANELLFRIKVEGTIGNSPAKVRMVCESEDVSYMFPGRPMKEGKDLVQFLVPKMGNRVKPGKYEARVEVMVENRYFVPVEFNVEFKDTLSVMGEGVKITGPSQKDSKTFDELKVEAGETPVNLTQLRKQEETINKKPDVNESITSRKHDGDVSDEIQREVVREVKKNLKTSNKRTVDEKTLRQIASSIISKKLR